MIAPFKQDEEETAVAETVAVRDWTREILKEGGALSAVMEKKGSSFEYRPQQLEMASAFAGLLEGGGHLAIEAGTGVGKSFAYLIPLIRYAVERQCQVVVSTYTISLQEQLIYKDLPFLKDALDVDFEAVLMKGMGNYLCLRRLARARRAGPDLFKKEQCAELEAIVEWSKETQEGSIQDLRHQPSYDVWDQVSVEPGNCLWQKCPEYNSCFYMKARREVAKAQIIVVNHHILFSDLAMQSFGGSLLPAYDCLVIDEAHHVESTASDHLGIRLSQRSFEFWLRRIFTVDGSRGLFKLTQNGPGAQMATKLYDQLGQMFTELSLWADFKGMANKRIIEQPLTVEAEVVSYMTQILRYVQMDLDTIEDGDLKAELSSAHRRGMDLRGQLSSFLGQNLDDQIYWLELKGKHRKYISLNSAPVEVGPYLADRLFDNHERILMTSATLAVGDRMDYFTDRVGANHAETLQVGSPFNYARQMKVRLHKNMPDPRDESAYAAEMIRLLPRLIDENDGDVFVLFTSDRLMRKVSAGIQASMDEQARKLYVQGMGLARHAMLEAFVGDSGSVLCGLDSFWTGVDVPGDALRMVVITRLPFTVPDQPIVQARMQRIKDKGGEPFKEYSLPEAILKFRQGVGRLIRSADDQGTVVILDPRVHQKFYGKLFLKSLPDCEIRWHEDEG